MNRVLRAALVAALLLALAAPAGAHVQRAEPARADATPADAAPADEGGGQALVADLRSPVVSAATPQAGLRGVDRAATASPLLADAAARDFAAGPEPWEDGSEHWYVLAECTEVTAVLLPEDDIASTLSPYGWDVTIAAAGGEPVALASNLHGFFGLTWEFHGAVPGVAYTVRVAPRTGYEGLDDEFTVTTSAGCPAAPVVEQLEATRSSTTYRITGAEDAEGITAWALGADGRRYDRPVFVLGEFAPIPAGEDTQVTIIAPAGAAHIYGFSLHSAAGRGAMGEATVSPAADVRTARRVSGSDRFETATELAVDATPVEPTTAVVANGLNFPDALAAANYATPVLLTTRDSLHPTARRYLEAARLQRVVVAGGPGVVSDAVIAQIRQIVSVPVDRIGGTGRYETGAKLAVDAFGNGATSSVVVVASGETHADALAAGALSAAGGFPLVLTAKGQLPSPSGDLLERIDPDLVLVAGGTAAVQAQVLDAISARVPMAEVERLSGPDRTRTASAIARWGTDNGIFSRVDAILARGDAFADALAASAVAGFRQAPVLLTAGPSALGLGAPEFLDAYGCVVEQLIVAGGPAAVPQAQVGSQTGACDPTLADQLVIEEVNAGIQFAEFLLEALDDTRRGEGHLDYVIGPATPRGERAHTGFDRAGDVGAAHLLPAPFAWRVAQPAGDDEALGPDEVTTLMLDRNGDRVCNAGEPALDVTLGSFEGTHRICP